MQVPQFSDSQFVDANAFDTAFATDKLSYEQIGALLHTPGVSNFSAATISPSGLNIDISAPSPFAVLFASGAVAQANGNTAGSISSSYVVNMASLVPGSGSVTAYIVASYSTVQQGAFQVVGPPPGHPDYDPTFAPYTAYTTLLDTLIIAGTLTAPDNATYVELGRVTLTAGQSTISSVNTLFVQRVGAILSQDGEVVAADLGAGAAAMNVGTLGGVLTGTLPNPGLAAGAASSNIGTLGGVLTGTLPNPGMAAGAAVTNIGFTPVQQGGGANQGTNKVYLGWQGAANLLRYQVDSTDEGNLVSLDYFDGYINQTVLTSSYPTFAGVATNTISSQYLYGGQPGYIHLTSGLIIQWGQTTTDNEVSVFFPIVFPNVCLSVVVSEANAAATWLSGQPTVHGVSGQNVGGFIHFTLGWSYGSSSWINVNATFNYIAIGY